MLQCLLEVFTSLCFLTRDTLHLQISKVFSSYLVMKKESIFPSNSKDLKHQPILQLLLQAKFFFVFLGMYLNYH